MTNIVNKDESEAALQHVQRDMASYDSCFHNLEIRFASGETLKRLLSDFIIKNDIHLRHSILE